VSDKEAQITFIVSLPFDRLKVLLYGGQKIWLQVCSHEYGHDDNSLEAYAKEPA
jgi:hypothetical protein